MRSFRPFLVVVCLAALAGCAQTSPGSPVAAGTAKRPPATSATPDGEAGETGETTAAPTSAPPGGSTRPKAIDMAAVDPCQLLRDVRPTDFGIDMATQGTGGVSSVFPGSKDCFASGIKANMGLGLTAVVSEGFESYTGSARAQVTGGEVAGFPFALVRPQRPESCFGVVDVNDGQMLYVSLGTGSGEPPAPQDRMCELVPKIAEAAMRALGA